MRIGPTVFLLYKDDRRVKRVMSNMKLFILLSILCVLLGMQVEIAAIQQLSDQPDSREISPDTEVLPIGEDEHLFYGLSMDGPTPMWEELVHTWNGDVEISLRLLNPLDPSDCALGDGCVDEEHVYEDSQISELLQILFFSGSKFRLSQESLENLKDQGVPDEILAELAPLEGQEFTEEADFLNTVEEYVGEEQTEEYERLFLEHASTEQSGTSARTRASSNDVRLYSWDITFNLEESIVAWNTALYYPRMAQRILSESRPKQLASNRPTPIAGTGDMPSYSLRALFKKWGLPTPRTVLLWGILIYLILALITRIARSQ
jgi:hypothetical protein